MRRHWVATALVCSAIGFGVATPTPALAQAAPPGFNDQLYASGLLEPTAMALAPDGRLFVTEQQGSIRIVRRGQPLVTFAEVPADHEGERGLLGIALHPSFAFNGFVYVYWSDPSIGSAHRITRLTANGDTGTNPTTIVQLDSHEAAVHNGGAMHFGPDGKLYVATGDNTARANAQTLDNRHGKILRYNDDGTVPTDNPFYNQATGENRAIYALGLRNPFTFNFGSGGIANINDVGDGAREEIDRLEAGANYGWPRWEGTVPGPEPGVALEFGTLKAPLYEYQNGGSSCAITGGAFYGGTQFPAEYQGDWFFGDYCGDWIRRIGAPTTDFVAGAQAPVDLLSHPDGSMLYLEYAAGTVRRLTYGAQVAPTITTHPSDVVYVLGQPVTFQVAATGTQPLLFRWQSETTGGGWVDVPGAVSSTITIATQPGIAVPRHRAVVTNSAGSATSNAASAIASSTAITIVNPARGALYRSGDTIPVEATAVDDDGNPLALEWRVVFHHNEHTHPALDWQPLVAGASFTVPPQGHDPGVHWYRFEFRATLPGGQQVSTSRDVFEGDVETADHFAPTAPIRVVDTRANLGGSRLAAGQVLEVAMPPPIPDATTAVAINLTSDGAAADGYLTAWPCGQPMPPTSTVNYVVGAPAAAGAIVGLGGGKLCVFTYRDSDVIIDVSGWSDPYPTTTRSVQALGPIRVEDTRLDGPPIPAGGTHVISLTAAGSGFAGNAVALNITSVDTLADGYVTMWACDQPMPATSNLNVRAGETRPNLAIVPVAADGTVCAFTYGGGHLVVDVVAAFLPGLSGDFDPVAPSRLVDTRSTVGRVDAGGVVTVAVPPGATAVALSLVATEPAADGYLTAYACGQAPPLASNVNYRAGQTIANGTITPVAADGTVCVTTYAPTHVIVDLTGVFT